MIMPAIVREYDGKTRYCRIEIPGVTDGSDELLQAEIMYPLGDNSESTEVEILAGDKVWVMFHQNDPRFPVILGYRTRNNNAFTGKRYWHQKEIEIKADTQIKFSVGTASIVIIPSSITITTALKSIVIKTTGVFITGNVSITGTFMAKLGSLLLRIAGSKFEVVATNTSIASTNTTITGTADINILKVNGAPYLDHNHSDVEPGVGQSGGVVP